MSLQLYYRHPTASTIVRDGSQSNNAAIESSYPVDLPLMGKLTDQALALAGFTYVAEGAAYVPPPPVPKGTTTTANTKPSCDSGPPSTDLIPSFGAADTQHTMHSCAKDTRTQDRFCLFSNICWKDGKFTYFRNPKIHLPWGDTNEFTEMQGVLNIMTDAIKPTLADVTPQVFAPPAFVESPIPAVFTRGKTDTTTFLAVNRYGCVKGRGEGKDHCPKLIYHRVHVRVRVACVLCYPYTVVHCSIYYPVLLVFLPFLLSVMPSMHL